MPRSHTSSSTAPVTPRPSARVLPDDTVPGSSRPGGRLLGTTDLHLRTYGERDRACDRRGQRRHGHRRVDPHRGYEQPVRRLGQQARQRGVVGGQTLATGYADRPTVAGGPPGVAVAAWVVSEGVESHVEGAVKGSSGWAPPVPLSASSGLTEQPRSAVDGPGHAYVTWPRYQNPYFVVQLAEWAPGGGWAPAVDLSAVGADARIVRIDANPAGHVVVGWTRSDGSKFRAQITTRSPVAPGRPRSTCRARGATPRCGTSASMRPPPSPPSGHAPTGPSTSSKARIGRREACGAWWRT